jgi:hypothetical protein
VYKLLLLILLSGSNWSKSSTRILANEVNNLPPIVIGLKVMILEISCIVLGSRLGSCKLVFK